jgi:hypothetical protein
VVTGSSVPQPAQGISNRVKATFPSWKNVQQIDGDKEVVGGVRAVATLGQTSYLDSDPVMAETNRRKIMDRAIADKLVVTGYHYSMRAPVRSSGMETATFLFR